MSKLILHLDADSFFASVEQIKNPLLKGKPVVTGAERGIVTSMSYEAKALGVPRGMPIFQLKKFYPTVRIVNSEYENYKLFSRKIYEILTRFTHLVEPYSIDEYFADISKYPKEDILELIKNIRDTIKSETDVPVSIGVSSTKVLAKIASKKNKPFGLCIIDENNLENILKEIPVAKLWGVGPSSQNLLSWLSIETAYEFTLLPIETLVKHADGPLINIWHELRQSEKIPFGLKLDHKKSIQKTLSFLPFKTIKSEVFGELARNIEIAMKSARSEKLVPSGFSIFLKDKHKRYFSDSITLKEKTLNTINILKIAKDIFDNLFEEGVTYKATGVTLFGLEKLEDLKLGLFENEKEKIEKDNLFDTIDYINKKFGKNIISTASSFKTNIEKEREYSRVSLHDNFLKKFHKQGKMLTIPYLGCIS